MNKSLALGLAVVAAGMTQGEVSFGGTKTPAPVTIMDYGNGTGLVVGSLGSTRNSSDSTNYIGCHNDVDSNGTWSGGCSARAGNKTVSCAFPPLDFINYFYALMNLTSDSYMQFSYDGSGNCTHLGVYEYSNYEPREF